MIQLTGPVEDDYYFLSLFLGERNNERWRTINQLIGVDGNLGGAVHRLGAKFRPSTQDVVSIKTFDGITETTGIITIRDKRMCDVWCSFAYARPRAWMRNQFESRLAAAVRFFFFCKIFTLPKLVRSASTHKTAISSSREYIFVAVVSSWGESSVYRWRDNNGGNIHLRRRQEVKWLGNRLDSMGIGVTRYCGKRKNKRRK